ncbi:MAG: hypothetical protein UU67_C0084G0010 [Candidatus Daviesbacteria bacterium GW2011_GWB1_41_5]|uniref:Uncharacterized protein n=1 Tax=Candidatus Daviesbacteria bacterium GW2011_GWB1_41_5 TaxID=1618429 RepID=A0A0G0ZDN4_9BACT|nr:MAG: hypothetical protein UU67_C0084G0010 [Candidatus Daviesbacteria bacterium GW2011_GWB1_41_5]
MNNLILWDVYEISSVNVVLHGVKCRRRIRNFGIEKNFNVLAENAVDKENVVRFAVISEIDASNLIDFIYKQLGDVKIENIARAINNPVLSTWKINDGKD